MKNKNQLIVLIMFILALTCVICVACDGGTKTYVGSNTEKEVTIVLNTDDTFSMTVNDLTTGSTNARSGSYQYVDSQNSVIKFTYSDSGYSFNCSVGTNIQGRPYLAIHTEYSSYPPCYLK